MIAARAGAQVIACEMNEPMAALARQVVAHNGLSARMEVRGVRSDALSLKDLGGRKADLVVSETLDSELLSEGTVPTLRHAQQELLAPGGAVVPHRARVYAELVSIDHTAEPGLGMLNAAATLRWGPLPAVSFPASTGGEAPAVFGPVDSGEWSPGGAMLTSAPLLVQVSLILTLNSEPLTPNPNPNAAARAGGP